MNSLNVPMFAVVHWLLMGVEPCGQTQTLFTHEEPPVHLRHQFAFFSTLQNTFAGRDCIRFREEPMQARDTERP